MVDRAVASSPPCYTVVPPPAARQEIARQCLSLPAGLRDVVAAALRGAPERPRADLARVAFSRRAQAIRAHERAIDGCSSIGSNRLRWGHYRTRRRPSSRNPAHRGVVVWLSAEPHAVRVHHDEGSARPGRVAEVARAVCGSRNTCASWHRRNDLAAIPVKPMRWCGKRSLPACSGRRCNSLLCNPLDRSRGNGAGTALHRSPRSRDPALPRLEPGGEAGPGAGRTGSRVVHSLRRAASTRLVLDSHAT